MKNFNFKSAANTKEATKLASSGRATFLAGGMTLLPAIKLRLAAYSDLINIKKIKSLSGIKVSSKSLRIGATTTHAEVAASFVFAADLKLKLFMFQAAAFLELFFFNSFQTFSAVAGIEISVPIASITAFITAGGAAIVPASPHPLAPKGFEVAGVDV